LSGKFCIAGNDLLTEKVLVIAAEVIQCRALPMPYFCLIVFEASLFQSFILDLFLLLFLFLFYFFRSHPVFVLFVQFQALSPKLSFPSFPLHFELPFISSSLHSPSLEPFYSFSQQSYLPVLSVDEACNTFDEKSHKRNKHEFFGPIIL